MRILTGGHAIWMGGWSGQVHHHQDVISRTGLQRPPDVLEKMIEVSQEVEAGTFLLPPEYALADSLIHRDHRIMPPDEIDPDYIDRDERPNLRRALLKLNCSEDDVADLIAPYEDVLSDGYSLSL